ncbi:hypothetical protein [Nocardia sp. NPDC058633]|uniref:hypothetical protein n=1 Tax=Nocardia sp. NPDC058633 TaxID=3346568 RepID=UPI003647F773
MSTEIPEPIATVTEYAISCLPETDRDRKHFTLFVRKSTGDLWRVCDRWGDRYDMHGKYVPAIDTNDEDLRRTTLMPLDKALEIAKRVAPTLTCNGKTVSDVLAAGGAR